MFLATPIWLLALVPWAGLAVWMLWGRRQRVNVPFLALWRDGDARPTSSRAASAPPLPIVLLLLSIFLGILAAGSPTRPSASSPTVSIIIDRGITMSARDGDSYRYAQSLRAVTKELGESSFTLLATLPAGEWAGAQIDASLDVIPPTAIDTSGDVEQAVVRALSGGDDPVAVITDRSLNVADPRLIVVPPAPLNANVGIEHVAARERPVAQVMVRLDGRPPSKQTVVVTSDGERTERTMDAPGTAFIDMPRLGKTVEVALAQGDALAADDRAWLARESGWPKIVVMATVPAELLRMIETYRKLRPPREDARVVPIVGDLTNAVGGAVIVARGQASAGGASPTVVDHPVTAGVAWAEVLKDARTGADVPAGFTPLVTDDDRVAVAVRETPARQVWAALDSATFPRRADYVVFWTNVFDWLGRGGDAFVAHPVGLLGDDWRRTTDGPANTEPGLWPGLYQRGDGTLRAVNAPRVTLPPSPAPTSDWRQRLSRLAPGRGGGRPLAPYLLLAALACALGAALLWFARPAAQT